MNLNKIKIVVQHFEGCPNGPKMIANVSEAIAKFPELIEYEEQLVETNEKAREVHFRGSPTLLINGQDFENLPEPESPSLACRFYGNGVPATEEIERYIKNLV
ncbi:MAG: DUF2703 domain-containing protein [Bacteroidota bacterium]|jgi:hypothetical protein